MMRVGKCRALAGCAVASVTTLCMQTVAQTSAAAATGTYSIAGTVVNASTGKPIERASVEILSEDNGRTVAAAVSDGDGHFVFERLAAGKYPLVASKRGYTTAFYNEHDNYNSAIVTGLDQDTGHLIFLLWPGAEVHGIVTADGGDPVEAARVMLFRRTNNHGPNGQMVTAGATPTDDTGAYEFGNLAPGEYAIAVIAQPWYAMHPPQGKSLDENSAQLDVAYPITYFDSTTDESSATPLKLSAGVREEADISLHAVPALRITVRMGLRADGRLARPELRQYVFGLDVGAQSAGFLDELKSGVVEFSGIAPGHYELSQGDPQRIVSLSATASQQIDPNAGTPSTSVSGMLRLYGGPAVMHRSQVVLTPVNDTGGQPLVTMAGRDGHFSFEFVPAGHWALSAGANGQPLLPVRSITSGGEAREGNLVTVSDHPLEIAATISSKVTRIEGFARKNGKGFAGALVLLAPRDTAELEVLSRRDQSDSDGSFALSQVVPGQYTLVAIEGGWDLDLSQPAVLARYLPRGTPVLVTDTSGDVVHLIESVAVQPR